LWGGSQTLAKPSSNVEHPVVPLTPNRHIPLLAITLASGIAIALLALRTPDFQPEDATVSPNLAPSVVEPSEADEGTELVESRIHLADQSGTPSDADESSTVSASPHDASATSCPEGHEPRNTSDGSSECVLLNSAAKPNPGTP
jgi:hypothetical protein